MQISLNGGWGGGGGGGGLELHPPCTIILRANPSGSTTAWYLYHSPELLPKSFK